MAAGDKLDDCNCCNWPMATVIDNRPGLPALAYRAGTWATFLDSMKLALADETRLAKLTSRAADDPAIALMDAWAVVGDILTFYQERIANEGFLRTAVERRSVLELARAIGYELGPGVAASTYLAFTVEQPIVPHAALPMPTTIAIPTGTRVQNVPQGAGQPQSFESIVDIEARVAWNVMAAKSMQRQRLSIVSAPSSDDDTVMVSALARMDPTTGATAVAASLYLSGTATNLRVGDLVLIQIGDDNHQPNDQVTPANGPICLYVTAVTPDYTNKRTQVDVEQPADSGDDPLFSLPSAGTDGIVDLALLELTPDNVRTQILNKDWTEPNLSAYLEVQGWDPDQVTTIVASLLAADPLPANVYAFRSHSGVFGHSALKFSSLLKAYNTTVDSQLPWGNWDTVDPTVFENSYGDTYPSQGPNLFLDRVANGLAKKTYIALDSPEDGAPATPEPFQVRRVKEKSLSDFAMSSKCSGLFLNDMDGNKISNDDVITDHAWANWRTTSVFFQSEALTLSEAPIAEAILAGDEPVSLVLSGMVLGLQEDQYVAWTGQTLDKNTLEPTGNTVSEVLTIDYVMHSRGYTTIYFMESLTNSYVRNTVTLNGNVAPATHGATTANEILGSGDGSQMHQSFILKAPPLTFTAAATLSGRQTTLVVRVSGVEWTEVDTLYTATPTDKVYIARQQPDGTTMITFGDGVRGARLPTGRNNITATYRTGTGVAGQLGANKITLLQTKPLGVKSAINPIEASGAADPEVLKDARENAPRTVRTLDRLVSLDDFSDFARSFAGVGKAQATPIWNGRETLVHLTLGDAYNAPLENDSITTGYLKQAVAAASDGRHKVDTDPYTARFFHLTLNLVIDPAYIITDVVKAAKKAIKAAYVYAERDIGQAVTEAEIVLITQDIDGVIATEVTELYDDTETATWHGVIQSFGAHWDDATQDVIPGDLILLHPAGLTVTGSNP
jgi:hypothetical protein